MRKYHDVDKIVQQDASDSIIEGCMVLEGGAWRSLYSAGVLDALMLNDINMRTTIGVSAGAMNGFNYVSGQIGRAAHINLTYRHNSEYCGIKAYSHNQGITGFDFLFNQVDDIYPFNADRFYEERRDFYAVACNCASGASKYFKKGETEDIFKAIQASASLPFLSKMVEVEGELYLDGGISDAIPYRFALANNYQKIIVIRTRNRDYRKKESGLSKHMNRRFYRNWPQLEQQLDTTSMRYNMMCRDLQHLEKKHRIFVIAPKKPLSIKRLEGNVEKLGALYWQGYQDGIQTIEALKQYLNK